MERTELERMQRIRTIKPARALVRGCATVLKEEEEMQSDVAGTPSRSMHLLLIELIAV